MCCLGTDCCAALKVVFDLKMIHIPTLTKASPWLIYVIFLYCHSHLQ